VLMSDLVVLVS